MTTMAKREQASQASQITQVQFIAFVIFLMGLAIFGLIAYLILQDETIVGPDVENLALRFWNFLTSLGLVRPILAMGVGFLLIRLSLRLRSLHVSAARWARSVLIWMLVLWSMGILQTLNTTLNSETSSGTASGAEFIANFAPWAVIGLILFSMLVVLNRNFGVFHGDEDTTQQNTRIAWNLLAPTLIILLMIGIGPLEQVFIKSLTNERFASSEAVDFIGLDNYGQLLGIRLDVLPDQLPCVTTSDGSCRTTTDNSGNEAIVEQSVRSYLSGEFASYRSEGYRPYEEFNLLGTQYALSVRDEEFIDSAITSVIYAVVAIGLQLVIGLFMAMILTARLRGMGFLRVAMLIPLAVPTLIATQFWDVMLLPNDSGIANQFLQNIGIIDEAQRWLLDPNLQLPALIVVIVWKETPSMALLLLPGLISISPEIYEASSVDGATRWQQFWRITLPMMRPTIGVALILRTMVMLRVFDVFEILVGQRKFSMATYAQHVLVQRQDLGYSSTISVTIFFIILIFTIFYMRSLRIDEA